MNRSARSARIVGVLERFSGWIILATVVATLLLAVPLLTLPPDEQASQDPSGEAFDLRDEIDERLESSVHLTAFVVESRDGDILTQAALLELYRNTQKLREVDSRGELAPEDLASVQYLYHSFDLDTNRPIVGMTTIADVVQEALAVVGLSLESATDDQVKVAVHFILSRPETAELADLLSIKATKEPRVVQGLEIDYWESPAFVFRLLSDNEKLGGGRLAIGVGGGEVVLNKEEYARNVQRVLRGDEETYRLWGLAIDSNLEGEDGGATAGVFIMFTVIAAVIIVGIALRSYWAMALTGTGLGVLMVWLKGITNLIGIEGGLVVELIVPIAMISLGVDFAVHALRRYQEERDLGHPPEAALRIGLAGVIGALVLAMLSDSVAFLANVPSGIEAVIHFGVAAAIAVVSSFVVLGVVLPLSMLSIDRVRSAARPASKVRTAARASAGVGVAALSGTAVILMVAVSPAAGLVVLVLTSVAFVVAPVAVMRRRSAGVDEAAESTIGTATDARKPEAGRLELAVTALARRARLTLLVTAAVTAGAVVLALRLDPDLDPKDFFAGDSDFVVSLDKLDEHVGPRAGEPGIVYIEGDLTQPDALTALKSLTADLSTNPYLAKDVEGELNTLTTLLDVVERATGSQYAKEQVALVTGVEISDSNGDGIPDSREEVAAVYDYIVEHGVPLDESTLVYDAGQVRMVIFHDPVNSGQNVTTIEVQIPDSREQTTVANAREALERDMAVLRGSQFVTRYGLTGSPFTREAQFAATTSTLKKSIPIAAVGAFVLLLIMMRSVRYAAVTIVPIGLVVAWLYGFMYVAGFSLNFVTATIGAISIGIGVDYSIHMTERFREELARASDKMQALQQAGRGTGAALLASAASSIVGFAIMGLAPMPLFASYGILTAVMIFLALAASLLVLPSLLVLVTPEPVELVAADEAVAGRSSGVGLSI